MKSESDALPFILPSAIITALVSVFGIIGNLHIVLATKYIRSPCYTFLAALAVGDIFHQTGHFVFLYFVATDRLFLDHSTCFYYYLLSVIGMLHSTPLCLAIGCDRLFGILFPLTYQQFTYDSLSYLLIILFSPFLYVFTVVAHAYFNIDRESEKECMTYILGFFPPSSLDFMNTANLIFYSLTVLIYASYWLTIYLKQSGVSNQLQVSMRPLTVITLMIIFGWLTSSLVLKVLMINGVKGLNLLIYIPYVGLLINTTISLNFFVCYAFRYIGNLMETEVSIHSKIIAAYFGVCIVVGTIGNGILVYTTIRSKTLRATCHYLITFLCLADIAHVCGHFTLIEFAFRGTLIPQVTCFYIMLLPMLGAFFCAPLLLALAIDRFIAVTFPYSYQKRSKAKYLTVLMIFPICIVTAEITVAFSNRCDSLIPCNITTSVGDDFRFFGKVTFFLYPMVAIVYFGVVLVLRKRGANYRFRSVFKSISVSVFILFCCWLFSIVLVNIAYILPISPSTHQTLLLYGGVAINGAITCNFFVFYTFSADYRNEVRRVIFSSFFNRVVPLT